MEKVLNTTKSTDLWAIYFVFFVCIIKTPKFKLDRNNSNRIWSTIYPIQEKKSIYNSAIYFCSKFPRSQFPGPMSWPTLQLAAGVQNVPTLISNFIRS